MTVASWPSSMLRPGKITRHIAARSSAGTVAASGFTQRVSAGAHAWLITYDAIVLSTTAELAAWDALAAALDGGVNPVLVELIGDGYGVASTGTTVGDASAGDTVIVIDRTDTPILAGQHFCIASERTYRIAEVQSVTGTNYTVSIRPPLRTDVPDGTTCDFNTLLIKCRLASDDEMSIAVDQARNAVPSAVRFVEDPNAD